MLISIINPVLSSSFLPRESWKLSLFNYKEKITVKLQSRNPIYIICIYIQTCRGSCYHSITHHHHHHYTHAYTRIHTHYISLRFITVGSSLNTHTHSLSLSLSLSIYIIFSRDAYTHTHTSPKKTLKASPIIYKSKPEEGTTSIVTRGIDNPWGVR